MSIRPKDPLLIAGRFLAYIGQAMMALAAIILIAVTLGINIFRSEFLAELADEFPELAMASPIATFSMAFIVGLGFVAIGWFFLGKLRAIIDTVAQGDPFAPVNATRLEQMGWLALASQLLAIPAAALGIYMAKALESSEHVEITSDVSVDPSGIMLVITLFILARVFKHGAAMREDLEGTV